MIEVPIGSSSRKRLLADPKPKQGSSAPAVVPSDFPDRKKTRDLPNFSDCHSCGLHVNATNLKDKLQTLASVWRIVLLCRNCLNRVESSKLCSYCFSLADSDCYRCIDCDHRVHKDCVVRFKGSAPWSYCSELGSFSVCIDCWLPKHLENSIRVCKKRRRDKIRENSGDCGRLEVVVNEAKRGMEKKTRVAAKAKESALRKAVVARRAAELANRALELVAMKDDGECSVTGSSSGSETTAAATGIDAELAFQLHRAINCSPRTSRNLCLMNSSRVPVPRLRKGSGNSSMTSGSRGSHNASVSGKMEECYSHKLIEDTDASVGSRASPSPNVGGKIEECPSHKSNGTTDVHISQPTVKVYVRRSDSGRCMSSSNSKQGVLVYTRRCKKDKQCLGKGGVVVGNCNTCDDSSPIFESQTCHKQDELEYELHLDEARNPNRLNSDGNGTVPNAERSNGKPDRYLLKYSKRSQDDCTMPLDESCNVKRDPCMIKYSKRRVGLKAILNDGTNFHYDDSTAQSKAGAVRVSLRLDCSGESRTLTDASSQSSPVSVEASTCVHV